MHEKVEKRLFLIDGYGFVFRAYHVLPPLTDPAGTPVGAVFGFLNMLNRLKNRFENAQANEIYILCVFDSGKETFRNQLYADYKANRPSPPDDLKVQFPLVRDAAQAMNVDVMEVVGYEADDIIATYCKLAQEQGIHVTIVSSDKDLMQLVNDNVKMYDEMKDKLIGREQVIEKFGVPPENVLDVLSLMGDSSDNIPGVPSVGPKTASDLINQFGNLESIYANVDKITKVKLKENLVNHKEDAFLSRELASLKDDVEVEKDISKFRMRKNDNDILLPFLQARGFKSMIAKIEGKGSLAKSMETIPGTVAAAPQKPVAEAIKNDEAKTIQTTPINSRADLASWLPNINQARKIAMDFIFSKEGELTEISLAKSAFEQCVIKPTEITSSPASKNNQDDLFASPQKQSSFKPYFEVLSPYLKSGACDFIFFGLKNIVKSGIDGFETPLAFDDIEIMNYAASGTTNQFKLEGDNRPIQLFLQHDILKHEIFLKKVNYIYSDIEKPLIKVLEDMEDAGIKIDKNILSGLAQEFNDKLKTLETEIYALAGEEFNIGSPKQLGEVLFDHMEIQGGKKSKSGNYSTDSDVLSEIAEQGHKIAEKLLEWRTFSKLISTYTNGLAAEMDKDTGRVHTTFNQASTTTGRLSSTAPNLQNIPIRTEEGRKIRRVFIAEPGNKLIGIDYSQIELRLLAHVANIPVLKEAFKNNMDIHTATAAQVFGIAPNEVNAEMRRRAKTVNFGIIYGQGAFGLASQLGIARGEAKTLIDKYFMQYPGIKKYMEETIQFAHEKEYVETIWGRKIFLPGINNKNGMIRSFNERAAINAPLQGTAADIIKRAMILIADELKKYNNKAKLLLQIHDELIFEAKEDVVQEVATKSKNIMEQVISLSVPLVAEPQIGNSWAEIH